MTAVADLAGNRGLVIGIANQDSIAAGCARRFREAGPELAVTYLNERAGSTIKRSSKSPVRSELPGSLGLFDACQHARSVTFLWPTAGIE